MAQKNLNPELLRGLVFKTSEKKMVEKDGRKGAQFIPVERSLTEEDVLDWKDKGDSVVIVTKDGKKYTVKKRPEIRGKEYGERSDGPVGSDRSDGQRQNPKIGS